MSAYRHGNRLIDALPARERAALAAAAGVFEVRLSEVIHQPGNDVGAVFFPIDAVLSVVVELATGETVEAGTVGCETASGIEVAFGAPLLRTTVCQGPGLVARVTVADFLRLVETYPVLDAAVRAVERARGYFVEQQVACNAVHTVTQRLAKWLLNMEDRAKRPEFALTHEYIAILLGVRRATVTGVAAELQRSGAIEYGRGTVRIVDRRKLEGIACECYAETRNVFDTAIATAVRYPNGTPAGRLPETAP